jgi:NAD(P)-dependent dehydrogenase (short-subunit alcohol dehydrogenase family)
LKETEVHIQGSTILITGANRGLGRALVEEALLRGATRIYAGMRTPMAQSDARVVPVALDVTDAEQIRRAAAEIDALDVLVNNAGLALYDDLSDRAVLERQLAVNLFGPQALTHAFSPQLRAARGAVVNVLSDAAMAPFPLVASYSVSKAAAFSMTQSLRALYAQRGVSVHAVLPGPIDTDMSRGVDIPKASPSDVARAVFDGVERGEEEIFPDPQSKRMADSWHASAAKAIARQHAEFVAQYVTRDSMNKD